MKMCYFTVLRHRFMTATSSPTNHLPVVLTSGHTAALFLITPAGYQTGNRSRMESVSPAGSVPLIQSSADMAIIIPTRDGATGT